MDQVDRERIRRNLVKLVDGTNYDPLIICMERLDKRDTIPSRLMLEWKNRRGYGYSTKQLNSNFYEDIQKRGPDAFSLLLESLQNSGHKNLAVLLDPTMRTQESESEDVPTKLKYPDEGMHYVYIDNSWQGKPCLHDREALQRFFEELGYTGFKDFKEIEDCGDDVGSLIVVNFCSLSNGGIVRENDWINQKFNKTCLDSKPKMLLSLCYMGENSKREVQQDSGKIFKWFRDFLHVTITIKKSVKKEGELSEEVMHLLKNLSDNNNLHFEEKMHKLQIVFTKHQLLPVVVLNTTSKVFFLKKSRHANGNDVS